MEKRLLRKNGSLQCYCRTVRCGSVKCLQYLKWIHNRRSQVPSGVSLVLVSDTFVRKSCLRDVTVIKIVYCRNIDYFDSFSYL